jgi:hypothetical protein
MIDRRDPPERPDIKPGLQSSHGKESITLNQLAEMIAKTTKTQVTTIQIFDIIQWNYDFPKKEKDGMSFLVAMEHMYNAEKIITIGGWDSRGFFFSNGKYAKHIKQNNKELLDIPKCVYRWFAWAKLPKVPPLTP